MFVLIFPTRVSRVWLFLVTVLLVGYIYETKSVFVKERLELPSSCKPHHPGSGTGMGQLNEVGVQTTRENVAREGQMEPLP